VFRFAGLDSGVLCAQHPTEKGGKKGNFVPNCVRMERRLPLFSHNGKKEKSGKIPSDRLSKIVQSEGKSGRGDLSFKLLNCGRSKISIEKQKEKKALAEVVQT